MRVVFDSQSSLQVRFPLDDALIIALAEAYLAHEQTLPAAEQVLTPTPALVTAALARDKTAWETAVKSEDERFQASVQFDQALAEAKPLLDQAIVHLKSKYIASLEMLRNWGLEVTKGQRGLSVRKPKGDKGWEQFLLAYTAQENSLPAAQRLSQVPLAQLTTLASTAEATRNGRLLARAKREGNILTRTSEAERLLDLLKVCGLVIMVSKYEGKIHSDLQLWGFDVAAADSQPGGAPSGGGATP